MDGEEDNNDEILEILNKIPNIHYPTGPVHSKSSKAKALICMDKNELEAIYYLVESHTPNLRFNAAHCYEKSLDHLENAQPLNKAYFNFQCTTVSIENKIQSMLTHVEEMPKEWTIVQLTSQFNFKENLEVNRDRYLTNDLHLTVFNCGHQQLPPFTTTVRPPRDNISGEIIEIRQEMSSIIKDNVSTLENFKAFCGKTFKYAGEKMAYAEARYLLNTRLENLVKEIQLRWLAEWRCLLIGQFVKDELETVIQAKVDEVNTTEKNKSLLKLLIKASGYLTVTEIKNGLLRVFPEHADKNLRISLGKDMQKMSSTYDFTQQLRHPVLLIVDEKLDILPWEMLDVLENHPVSRMPSLHFTYALFKEHEDSIVNGVKVNIGTEQGTYLINPGLDLKNMETRLKNFFQYWLPDWFGLAGVVPSEDDFKNLLTTGDIFIYSGHGNGTQFFASEKIQKMRINKVVLLFGCSSVSLTALGPQVEMFGSYQMYQIACSPCIVGMLWPVTDVDTDLVTTELLSQWIPSKPATHWKLIDKKKWEKDGTVVASKTTNTLCNIEEHEPELLRALCKAKKVARQYLMKAACVARGLPVKVE